MISEKSESGKKTPATERSHQHFRHQHRHRADGRGESCVRGGAGREAYRAWQELW